MAGTPVRAAYADRVLDTNGRPIAGASITVRQVGTATAITETIYADATGSGTLSNPLTADSLGYFQFYLDVPKRVDLYVSGTGYTVQTIEDADVIRPGYVTENSGTATILNTTTSIVVTHGLAVTPTLTDISVLAGEDPTNSVGLIWVDTITSTQFTIHCEADPGASNLDLGWKAVVL